MIVRVFFFSFLSLGLLEVLSHDGIVPLVQSLDGEWNLWNSNKSFFLPARVPGCVHTALQQRGLIQVSSKRMHPKSRVCISWATFWSTVRIEPFLCCYFLCHS